MDYIPHIVLMIAGAFAFDRLGLWMENKGWIYYRHKKATGGCGNALQEFNALLNPAARQVVEAKQKVSKQEDRHGDGGSPPAE